MGEEAELMREFNAIAEEILSCEKDLKELDDVLQAGGLLSKEQAGRFDELSKRLSTLKKRVVVNMHKSNIPHERIAQQIGVTPSRVCQILAEFTRGN